MTSSLLKSLPVGYRFHPTGHELINHYLKFKNQGHHHIVSNIPEIDVCKWEPWEIPGHLGSESDDQEWYFFGRRDSNRATNQGYWKPIGRGRNVNALGSNQVIGMMKTLVFHRRSPNEWTWWIMHEFRASADKDNPQAFVLYILKKQPDKSTNTDEVELNISSSSSVLLNNVPSNSPTVHQELGNFSSPDQPHFTQSLNDQEQFNHG